MQSVIDRFERLEEDTLHEQDEEKDRRAGLVSVALSRRIDKPMPLDTFEKIAISMAVVGVIGGIGALAYLIQSMPWRAWVIGTSGLFLLGKIRLK